MFQRPREVVVFRLAHARLIWFCTVFVVVTQLVLISIQELKVMAETCQLIAHHG